MVLETHMKLCGRAGFFEKIFLPGQKWIFKIFWKNWSLLFPEFDLWWKFILFAIFLHKSQIWEKSSSWDMGQSALGQSDCRIFNSNISVEQNDEIVIFFAWWYKFMEIRNWLKNIWVGAAKNGCSYSGYRTLKLAVSQEGINGINWFFLHDDTNSRRQKVNLIIAGWVWSFSSWTLGHGHLKSVYQVWADELSWFFICQHKSW